MLADRRKRRAGISIGHLEDAVGCCGGSTSTCGWTTGPCERENGDSVVGAGNDGPGRRRRIKLHKLVCARCGHDEIRECGEKRIADCDSTRKGGEGEADAAGLGGSLGIDAHLQGIHDACVEGLELGDGTVAPILLRVVDVAHGVVAEDGVKSGVCEAERR
jgi:hypothetical protein